MALALVLSGEVRAQTVGTALGRDWPQYAVLAGLTFIAAVSLSTRLRPRSARRPDAWAEAVQVELDALREENAKLRLQQQRALSVGRAAERIRETSAAATAAGNDDEAWDALTEATVMRTALSAICQDLLSAVGHMERRLSTMVPGPELDRRLARVSSIVPSMDRRAPANANGHNGHNGHNGNGHNGNGHNGNGHNGHGHNGNELSLATTAPFSADIASGSPS